MLQTLLASLLGVLFGIFAGLIPGMHINNFVPFIVGLNDWPINLASFLVGALISYNFFEFLRTNLLSIPSDVSILTVHPVKKMMMKGAGFKAIRLYAFGALISNFLFLSTILIMFKILPWLHSKLRNHMVLVLLFVISLLILREKGTKNMLLATIFFLMSGSIGVLTFVLDFTNPFLPMLSGFFGVGYIIANFNTTTKIPPQIESIRPRLTFKEKIKSCFMGYFSSFLMVLIPSFTSSQSTLVTRYLTKTNEEEFITSIGAISNLDVLFSLTSLYLVNRSRSGTIEGVKQLLTLDSQTYLFLLLLSVFISILSYFLFLKSSKVLFNVLQNKNLTYIYILSILLIAIFCFYFDGVRGLLILSLSSYIGYLSNKKNISRAHLLGCLNVVTLLLFIGVL